AGVMGGLESASDLDAPAEHVGYGWSRALGRTGRHDLLKARAGKVLHDHVAQAGFLAGGVHGHDVRMTKPGGGPDLAQEAIGALAGAEHVGPEDLDRNLAAERFVLGEKDDSHRSRPDPADEPVLADALQGKRCV